MSYGRMKRSLALVGNHLEMVSREKYRWLCNLKPTKPHMSEMSNQNFENKGVNGARPLGEGSSPGSWFLVHQREPSHHQVSARMKWNKEVNKIVMECFYRSKPFDEEGKPVRGYRQRMFREWRDRGLFESTEQLYVTKQGQLGKMNGYHSLNWKPLKGK